MSCRSRLLKQRRDPYRHPTDDEVCRAVTSVPTHFTSWTVANSGAAHITASQQANGGGGDINTGSITTTGATVIVIAIAGYTGGGGWSSVHDNKSNTYTTGSTYTGGNAQITLYYCLNPTVGAGHTFSAITIAPANFASLAVAAFTGFTPTATDKTSGAGSASVTSQAPGNVNTTQANELCVTALSFGSTAGAQTISIDSSYTITDQYNDTSVTVDGIALAFLSQVSAGATNPTWSTSQSAEKMAAALVTIETGAAASAGLFMRNPMTGLGVGGPFFANPIG